MTAAEAARAILDFYGGDASKWCQGAWAMTAHNVITGPMDTNAVKWCISGACQMVNIDNHGYCRLKRLLDGSIPDFNDVYGRTFADVIARLETIANE